MSKKMVFFDIDGTLLNHEKKVPASTKEAIRQLKENGVYVAIATGRAPFMFEAIRKQLEIESFVSYNGQYVVFEGETVYQSPLSAQGLSRLFNHSLSCNYPMVFMGNKEMRASTEGSTYIKESLNSLKFAYPEIDDEYYKHHTIYQALLFCGKGEEEAMKDEYDEFRFIRWHDFSCDVLPEGGSKAIGIRQLISACGLDIDETYAFGDGLNDMEMLTEIGTGIAMGNAVPELKQVADHVTDAVDRDGIMKGLKRYKLI
ncbi:Cof-type HAD-IIB family hydrolase [Virgibacillus dakarensis]|uniref:Phosphatase n=1 Tax=Lentibacillus populi TaxID=1827502 RepID=A0A9W5U178_9BACI|nr:MULTISPECIES: Cof-type HAD-IIB family hydrolase [Bacillaceae]MBT2216189.1 Cof-type HAD-IIB family hydrolase [Virgibacillus dakarensis]MTW85402.1 Cof-type HAD-IIB family hydrolase [Virgibacillus dakarensis]GGB59044.1 phosphatase [Lentibacillus populi]